MVRLSPRAQLRRHAFHQTLGPRATLPAVLRRLGYVQADPIQAPARAQDLILVQRVEGYRAGELERRYSKLDCAEERLHNYGFVTGAVRRLLHPRPRAVAHAAWKTSAPMVARVRAVVEELGEAHPRAVEGVLGRSSSVNFWGGKSSDTTRALELLHFLGDLRVLRREKGVRVYGMAPPEPEPLDLATRADGILALLLRQYAPLPEVSLRYLLRLSVYGNPDLKVALQEAVRRAPLRSLELDGVRYLWPDGEPALEEAPREVRLLAPFDPLVWDRQRFEQLHGWAYRFEAYTPESQRRFGYYALPLCWGDAVIGWANLRREGEELHAELGFAGKKPGSRAFDRALEEELERLRVFLVEPRVTPPGAGGARARSAARRG
ncbi:MAG: winged helix DNA-binding domain-containing protein [Polyangiaceae bacterium]|jgi:hypothetical protein|nr:winged helix DNA-binding domain-containing protein [Polyangiaceae bacterium]